MLHRAKKLVLFFSKQSVLVPRLRRFLGESRRQRLHQETTFWMSFMEPQLPTQPLLRAAA